MSAAQPIRSFEDVQRFKNYFLKRGEYRNYLLVSICLNTALRIGDVLSLKWSDIIQPSTGCIREHIVLTETKTGKKTVIKINKTIKNAVKLYLKNGRGNSEYLFAGNHKGSLTRTNAFYIIKKAGEKIGLDHKISPHSLRKTFGYHAVKNGTPPAVLMQIFNHSSYEITKRYIGITQDEKDMVYMTVNL